MNKQDQDRHRQTSSGVVKLSQHRPDICPQSQRLSVTPCPPESTLPPEVPLISDLSWLSTRDKLLSSCYRRRATARAPVAPALQLPLYGSGSTVPVLQLLLYGFWSTAPALLSMCYGYSTCSLAPILAVPARASQTFASSSSTAVCHRRTHCSSYDQSQAPTLSVPARASPTWAF